MGGGDAGGGDTGPGVETGTALSTGDMGSMIDTGATSGMGTGATSGMGTGGVPEGGAPAGDRSGPQLAFAPPNVAPSAAAPSTAGGGRISSSGGGGSPVFAPPATSAPAFVPSPARTVFPQAPSALPAPVRTVARAAPAAASGGIPPELLNMARTGSPQQRQAALQSYLSDIGFFRGPTSTGKSAADILQDVYRKMGLL